METLVIYTFASVKVSECKVPDERGKGKVWRGFVTHYYDLKQNLHLLNNLWSWYVRDSPRLEKKTFYEASRCI